MAHRFGHVAVVGQPNVGKSTLINFIVGHKVSIVSSKPQTTRKRVMGIVTRPEYQIAFIDTPGIHEPHNRLQRSMVEQARGSLDGIDVILVVVDGAKAPDEIDESIAKLVRTNKSVPVVLCLNKMDHLKAEHVVRHVEAYGEMFGTDEYMLTTATKGQNVGKLLDIVLSHLPERAPFYPEDEFTDQTARFIAAEYVREKILLKTRQEVPHATAVVVESWDERADGIVHISASIIVDKDSQRAILLGKHGQFIKTVGTEARADLEEMLGHQVFLELHVRVQAGWRQNPRMLHELDYDG
ncbi:MAG: GTPase Era [Armatimonadetes bacterium]|nr:GTPase Era [Armatimonadota bacterium]MBS1702411.1 GTPase Era [Armatimonadota bacterium]